MFDLTDGWNLYNSSYEVEYGYIISNVELKVEIQHQVMLLIQKLIYHFYSFLSLSDLKCLR